VQRHRRQIGERLVAGLHQLGQEVDELLAAEQHLVVVGAELLGERPREGQLGFMTRIIEADRERVEVTMPELDGGGADCARVDAPAQQNPDRDVGGQ
jgi:hypothetical protein